VTDALTLAIEVTTFVLAPLAVALLFGLDRKITARMQNRVGPPVIQPFYDLFKLFRKQRVLLNSAQAAFAVLALGAQIVALAIFVTGGDLLVVFFVQGAGSVAIVMGAFSARSPFSYLGSQRELLQILACEPVIFLVVIALGIQQGSFLVRDMNTPLISYLPLAYVALVAVLVIKLQKSPYDIATAHSELISGPHIEYSGPYLATIELSHWFEMAVIFGMLTLFWWQSDPYLTLIGKFLTVFVALFAAILLDNATARLTRARMVRFTLAFGIVLVAVNLIWTLYVSKVVGL
jgi:ech hydrogenase subunit B